ncbi:nucleotidyltransferase family protein [Lacimicrobium alkaliphilum]|uniref:Xanthine dehydrogenase n=1 Tax=Lacimicrobium alkaliphilum TaxID=1526571 RepID=A0ABQ1RHV0_9ALTE|nr:nucleotidyltransferase family protein [Lacimicrobium alkaliphilum]GGD68548.1 xanthine dehydrogenase [Lacimicrobium alkaliphilum]
MSIAAIMLAAGQSRRFGAIKQLAEIRNKPMICHALAQLPADLNPVYLVLGAHWQQISDVVQRHCEFGKIKRIIAPHWQKGMGYSLNFAISQLAPDIERVLVCLADQVDIRESDYARLMALSDQYPKNIVAAYYQHTLGVPAIFCKADFNALMQLTGDKGAKALLYNSGDRVVKCELPRAAKDIDRQQDLTREILSG